MHYIPQFLDKTGASTNVLEPAAMGRLGFGAFCVWVGGWVFATRDRTSVSQPARQETANHSHDTDATSYTATEWRSGHSLSPDSDASSNHQFHQSILINSSLSFYTPLFNTALRHIRPLSMTRNILALTRDYINSSSSQPSHATVYSI